MENDFTTFKKYPDVTQAKELQQFLEANEIECQMVANGSQLDSNFSSALLKEFEIQVKLPDFEKAKELVEAAVAEHLDDLPDDYYMFDFTDEELLDVVVKQDEWSEFDYLLARKLLAERGKPIDEELIQSLNKRRIEDLSKPEGNQHAWVIAGYFLAIIGGFLGIIIGYVLWTSEKTLPNGTHVKSYLESDRKHGKYIFIIGCIVFIITMTLRFSSILEVFN